MRNKQTYLGEFEEVVLLAIARLGQNAYGMTIRQTVEVAMNRSVSVGAIYTTLDRLEQKGLVSSWQGEATRERGGRAKRYFKIEIDGEQALQEADRVRKALQPVPGLSVALTSI